jgi:FkbM family methyltransferase
MDVGERWARVLERHGGRDIGLRAVRVGADHLYVDTLADYAAAWAWRLGRRDAAAQRWITRHVGPGMVAVDIGAHLGAYTLALAHAVGPNGHVVALEPDAHNFDLLTRAAPRWRFAHVDTRALAAADYSGWVTLHRSASDSGDHRIVPVEPQRARVTVRALRLDEVLADAPRLDVIKLTVQGAEALVLRGARQLLSRFPEVRLLCAVAPALLERSGTSAAALFEPLADVGLQPHLLRADGEAETAHPTVVWTCAQAVGRLMVLFQRLPGAD